MSEATVNEASENVTGAQSGTKAPTPKKEKPKGARKVRVGYVVSDKMQKTIVVELEDRKRHSLYGKIMRSNVKVKAHDEDETAGVGDRVRIVETRPMSKDKHYRLDEIVEKAQ